MTTSVVTQVIAILMDTIPNYKADFWHEETELVGAIAEFDSMAIVTIIGEIEDRFDVIIDDEDISAENFATVNTLTQLIVERKS
ncbi:acyl carrier protein [Colwellia sp. RSH04]|uniref:acyl carrier protein n=1 Tax=Colwellia sp. RSH04 TaxID=2305464 RepID=UPI000E595320|nr:acyl carrier protein [Colwellia sp. RSH04]RHW75709.1 acyl carrier protein [Colwellia sp. RSH04]